MKTKIWFTWRGLEFLTDEEVQTVITDSPEEFKAKLGAYVVIHKEEEYEAVQ